MYKQLKKFPKFINRKNGLLLVLFVSITTLTVFLYPAKFGSFFKSILLAGDPRLKWAYFIAAIAIILFFIIASLLVRNIKRRKKISKELVMLKEYYCIAMNTISEGLITTGKKGEVFYMNPVAERLTGWTRLEAQNLPLEEVYDVVNEESGKSFEHIVSRILKKGERIVYENNTMLHAKNKKKLIIRNNGAPLFDSEGNISGTVLVFNDITERKKIENRLKRSLKLNKGMINSLSSRIVVIDVSGKIIKVNKSWNTFAQHRGIVTVDNFGKGANYFDVWKNECKTTPGIHEKVMTGIAKVLDGSLDEFYLEYPCFSPQRDSWFSMFVTKFISAEALAVIELHDITERKRAEEKTQKAIERYDILARATSDTIWDWDIISNKMLYNTSITKMFGYEKAEITNVLEWWDKNVHPDDFQAVSNSLAEVFDNKLETIQLEYRFRCADGTYKHIYDRAFVIYGEDHKAVRVIGSMQDVTYKKDEEERISRAIINAQEQERCHIGLELHDNVNQILAGTQLTLSMAKDKLIEREKMVEFIDISKAYIANAIDELRKLSHELVPASFDDSTLRNDFENLLLDINLNNQFDVYFHFDEGINDAVGEDIQINLYRILQEQMKNIVNYSGADRIEIVLTLNSGIVRMRTFDNGKGFDTKYIKKGIGLSNMKKRADSFSGKFFLNSSPGKGCEIIIEIPVPS